MLFTEGNACQSELVKVLQSIFFERGGKNLTLLLCAVDTMGHYKEPLLPMARYIHQILMIRYTLILQAKVINRNKKIDRNEMCKSFPSLKVYSMGQN